MIDDKKIKVSEAIQYLVDTDDAYGQMKGLVKGLEYRIKVCKAMEFLKADGSAAEREQKATASQAYKDLVKEYQDAVTDFETVAARRETRILTVEVWRSQNANKRVGNI